MITAIIVAAGKGERMKSKTNKPFLHLSGKPLLSWTLEAFVKSSVSNILIVANPSEIEKMTSLIAEHNIEKVLGILPGGEKRQDSVATALDFLPEQANIVAIHDGARPLIKPAKIDELIGKIEGYDGVIPAVIPTDTIKEVNEDLVEKTLNRKNLRTVQTPEIFKKESLLKSYAQAKKDRFYATDDAALLERFGYKIKVSEGSYDNIKITNRTDLLVAERLLSNKVKVEDFS